MAILLRDNLISADSKDLLNNILQACLKHQIVKGHVTTISLSLQPLTNAFNPLPGHQTLSQSSLVMLICCSTKHQDYYAVTLG